MKVLQINSFFSEGGPPRIVKALYDTLIAEEHTCCVAAARAKPYDYMNIIRIGNKWGVYKNAIVSRLFDCEGFTAKRATKALIKQIEEYNPDIIHLHNLHGYYLNIEILFEYLKKADKPVVWTLHDCWAFTGHCSHFDYIGCNKWKEGGCFDCPQSKEYPSSCGKDRSKKNFLKKKDAFTGVKNLTIITPSQWLADLVKQSFLSEYPVCVIPNGIDLDVFKPTQSNFRERYQLQNKKVVLGVAQNWGVRKGLNDFIKLSTLLPESYQIVLVGLTEKQIKEIPKNILALPRTNNAQELVEIYTAADVFVNPTYEDNFPTVNLEAQACGTPVITYNTGGSGESIPVENVVKQGNIEGIIMRLGELKDSAEDCITRVRNYDKAKKYNEYIEIYKRSL